MSEDFRTAPYPTGPGTAGPPTGYAPTGYPPAGYAPEHPDGTTILVLGLLSLAVGATGPVAWYLGAKAEKQIAASGLVYSNTQNIRIGKTVGMVMSILLIVGVVAMVVWMIFMFSMMAGLIASIPHS